MSVVTHENGNQEWYDDAGFLHRDDGPAVIWATGREEWYRHGERHRDGGPAVTEPDGTQKWYRHGERHRDDGPAVVFPDGSVKWFRNDLLHRDDGPAESLADGTQFWYRDGLPHREDGPAVIKADGSQEWYLNDVKMVPNFHVITKEEIRAHGEKHAEKLVSLIRAGMESLLLEGQRLPVEASEGIVSVGKYLTVEPTMLVVAGIGGANQILAWEVLKWVKISNYPHEPDDVSELEVAEERDIVCAARRVVIELWTECSEVYWENVGIGEMLEEESGLTEG